MTPTLYYVRGVTERWLRVPSGTIVEWRYLKVLVHIRPDSTVSNSVECWSSRWRQSRPQDVRLAALPLPQGADTSTVSKALLAAADALTALAIYMDDSPPDETQPIRSVPP